MRPAPDLGFVCPVLPPLDLWGEQPDWIASNRLPSDPRPTAAPDATMTELAAKSLSARAAPAVGGAVDQAFSFSDADFQRVRELIYQRAGISLNAGKHAMVYSRLSRRLRDTSHRTFASYLQWLQANNGPSGDAEWQEFVNCLTTNLTSFFREDHHFHALVDDLRAHPGRALRIWCSAASTGEEPYSIAMTVAETLGTQAQIGRAHV